MIDALHSAFGVGVEAQHLTIPQVVLRAVLIFFAALCIVRVANKRFFAKKPAQARLARLERSGEISVIPKAM
jgi:uncharacterized membrane protein YcaP (DUF421 family)